MAGNKTSMVQGKQQAKYILITSMNFPGGGAGATYINLLCRGLKSNRYSIKVLLLKGYAFGNNKYNGPRSNITGDGIPYKYLGFKQRPVNQFLKICEEIFSVCHFCIYLPLLLIREGRSINLLIFNSEIQFNVPILLFSKIFRVKVIKLVAELIDKSEFNSSIFGVFKRFGYLFNHKYLNQLSDKLIVFSHYLNNEYVRMGYNQDDIIIQPNLTDFEYWDPVETNIKYTLGYSGAPYLKDGLNDLFKAISLLQNININVSLLVVGDAVFGKTLLPILRDKCKNLGIAEKVTFTGLVESLKVKEYLSECEILSITRPSTAQTKAGFPTKLGEYFATKKPVLATNFGDMELYFTDGQDIIMAECGNPESIANKIKWMLENSKELELITARGYERAWELLEYKKSVNRMFKLLN